MVVHDEESLEAALLLVADGPVRYSDEYMYCIYADRDTLESRLRSVLERDDVAVIVPLGSALLDHRVALRGVREQRKREERKRVKEYIREHPGVVARVKKLMEEGK